MFLRNRIVLAGALLVFVSSAAWGFRAARTQKKNEVMRADLKRLASAINRDFYKIREEVERVALYAAGLYDDQVKADLLAKVDVTKYQLAGNGVFYKPQNDERFC